MSRQRSVASAYARAVSALPYSASGVSPWPYPANGRYYILQHYSADNGSIPQQGAANGHYCIAMPIARTAGMSRSRVPRTGVIALHSHIARPAGMSRSRAPRTSVITLYNLIPRPARFINNITMPRSARRLCRAPFYYFKQIAHARHPTLCWVMRSGAFAFAEHIKYSLASRKTAAFAGGVSPPPYPANGRYCIVQPYSADSEVAMPPYPCFTRNDNCTRSLLKAEFTDAMSF